MHPLQKIRSWAWWKWIIAVDLFLVLLTILHAHLIPYPGDSINPFNLAGEMNFAAWWSGIQLFILGLLAYELYGTRHDGTGSAWLVLAAIGAGLSLDELGSLHERLAIAFGWEAFIPVAIVGATAAAYSFLVLLRRANTRRAALWLMLGLLIMSSAVVYEYFERIVDWPQWMIGLRVGMEEGTELLGMFLCLWGIVPQRRLATVPTSISRLIPISARMPGLSMLLPLGLLLHLLMSVLFGHSVQSEFRGNPLAWYPSMVFLLLACVSLWHAWNPENQRRGVWTLLALYFALSSVAMLTMYQIQERERLLSALGPLANFFGQLAVQLGLLLLFYFGIYGHISKQHAVEFLLLAVALCAGFWLNTFVVQYMVTGIFALLTAHIFFQRNAEVTSVARSEFKGTALGRAEASS